MANTPNQTHTPQASPVAPQIPKSLGSIPTQPPPPTPVKKLPKSRLAKYALPGILALLVIVAGIGTGLALSGGSVLSSKTESAEDNVEVKTDASGEVTQAGVDDEVAFPDTAEGILEEGGLDGEGTHHLDTGFGPSKFVYLTSSVIPLDGFIGKTVEVRGQTIAGQNAGWLMDVGRVKVIE